MQGDGRGGRGPITMGKKHRGKLSSLKPMDMRRASGAPKRGLYNKKSGPLTSRVAGQRKARGGDS